MSGGAYDYAYSGIERFADDLRAGTPLRNAFRSLLYDVAEAAKAIEWVDSGDWSEGREDEYIRRCLPEHADLAALVAEARRLKDALNEALAE